MVYIFLIVGALIWIGYRYGVAPTNSRSGGPETKRRLPLYPTAVERRGTYAAERNARLAPVSPETPNWLGEYLTECESPAEKAFLQAMVNEYSLLPDKGTLRSTDLALQLQVDKGAYRVDFLANDWLVIEIDGAEYHSSPEQISSDLSRDKYLQSLGYTVMRMAAKVVFQQPRKSLSDTRSALAEGRKQPPKAATRPAEVQKLRPAPTNAFSALSRGVEVVGEIAKQVNDYADRQRAIQSATRGAENIFLQEKLLIESALKIAESKMSLERYIDGDPDRQARINGIMAEFDLALRDPDIRSNGDRVVDRPVPIPKIIKPAPHPDPEINESIERSHFALLNTRATYFETVRVQLKTDLRLATLVRAAFVEMGHHCTWTEFNGGPGAFSRLHGVPLLATIQPSISRGL